MRMGTVAPAAKVNGLEGFEVTPAGSAPSAIWTEPVNPFKLFTIILIAGLVAPCKTVTEFGERPTEKSAAGGGGGCVKDAAPQPAHSSARRRTITGTP
jgi:hypothetical protein